jgi:uncharacterized membrane protein YedE/YeeE
MDFLRELRWSPYVAGAGIGVLSWFAFLFLNKPLGCSTAFAGTGGMIRILLRGKGKTETNAYYRKFPSVIDWEWMLVLGIFTGAAISSLLSGSFHFQLIPFTWESAFGSSAILRMISAVTGGVLIGFGSRWAGGCTSGHGISGTMQLTVSSWVAAICFFAGGIASAFLLYGSQNAGGL